MNLKRRFKPRKTNHSYNAMSVHRAGKRTIVVISLSFRVFRVSDLRVSAVPLRSPRWNRNGFSLSNPSGIGPEVCPTPEQLHRRFANRLNVRSGSNVSTKPPNRSKPVGKPALRLSTKDSRMRPPGTLDSLAAQRAWSRKNCCGIPGAMGLVKINCPLTRSQRLVAMGVQLAAGRPALVEARA